MSDDHIGVKIDGIIYVKLDDVKLMRAHIEKLEAALREVIGCWDWWQVDTYDRCASVPADAIRDARKALEGKDGR